MEKQIELNVETNFNNEAWFVDLLDVEVLSIGGGELTTNIG